MTCKLCKKGAGFGEGMTQREMASHYGVAQATVNRHRKHVGLTPSEDYLGSFGLDASNYEVERVTVRTENNSYLKFRKTAQGVLKDFSDDIEPLFDLPVSLPPVSGNDLAEVLALADLQIGKAGERGGGTPETIARVRNAIAAFVERVKRSQPQWVVLVDGGDGIENVFNTDSQRFTNDLDVPNQIRTFRRLMAEAIRAVAPHAPNIFFVSVPSNHGGFRVARGTQGGTIDADFGLDVNYALEEQFEGRAGYEHVKFVRPDALEDTATLEVAATKLAFNHGYESRGIHKHGEWWAKRDHGRQKGWDADILVMAHYHTFNVQHSGNARWIIAVSSPDPGSDWYTRITGNSSLAGLTAFSVSNGMWKDIEIL